MKKNLQKWMGLLLALCLLTMPVFAGYADEYSEPEPTAVPATPVPATPEPTPVPTPEPTEAPTPEPVVTPAPTEEPVATPEVTNPPEEEPTDVPSAEPSEEPVDMTLALDDALLIEERPYTFEGGVLTLTENVTVADLKAAVKEDGITVTSIVIPAGVQLSGDGSVAVPVTNNGTISGGTYADVVNNYGSITGGEFAGTVNNGEQQLEPNPNPDPNATPTPRPKQGSIVGGTFTKDSVLNNYWNVQKAEINGTISAGYGSEAKSDCTYGDTAKVGTLHPGGLIMVKFNIVGGQGEAAYGANILETLEKLGIAQDGYKWCWYESDPAAKVDVTSEDTFDLRVLSFVQEEDSEPTTTTAAQVTTTTTEKKTTTTTTTTKTTTTTTTTNSKYPWEGSASSSNGEVEGEESGVGGNSDLETALVNDFLWDGVNGNLGIMSDAQGAEVAYELVFVPGSEEEDAAADQTGEPQLLVVETEEADEDDGRIPGEAAEDGTVPGMVFVRAKGIGTESRTLTLNLAQIKHMIEEQDAQVLLFRNGTATISMEMSALLEGSVPKLASLMNAWVYNETDFAEYDLAQIDFDAIQMTAEITDEELRAFELKLTIAPAVPVGYEVHTELWLGDNYKEIGLLLDKMGITMHAQTASEDVAVYYMNEAQERFLLESHRGVVPGVSDEINGYEVVLSEGKYAVLSLNRSVTDGEFEGLCAVTGDVGTYYIGILPTAE